MKAFPIPMDAMVVTSTYVTEDQLPILYVSHEDDEEGGSLWQFHCGNGDFSSDKMQLVRLDTVLAFDPELTALADLKKSFCATRKSPRDPWDIAHE